MIEVPTNVQLHATGSSLHAQVEYSVSGWEKWKNSYGLYCWSGIFEH